MALKLWLKQTEQNVQIGGSGKIVEMDETCVVKKLKYGRGSGGDRDDRWVSGMIERSQNGLRGDCRVIYVKNRRRATIIPLIEKYVRRGTRLISDNFVIYKCLGDMGWNHDMVNHSAEFVETWDSSVHTETIEGIPCDKFICFP